MEKSLLFLLLFFGIFLDGFSQEEIPDTFMLEEIIVIPSPFSSYIDTDHAFGNLHWKSDDAKLNENSFLNEALIVSPSVHINDATTNPIGQDLQIRGFHASPLYGLAQEIAIYADGIRQNDLLGDAVFWDLMPTFAMNKAQVFVGSQPLFGLNALGGTINYTTKSGFTNPGKSISVSYGAFNRLNAIAEYGDQKGNFAWYLGANFWREKGWRNFSESEIANTFGKLSYKKEKNFLNLSFQFASSDLLGNGAFPLELLERDEWRNQIFTHPDRTENRLWNVNINWDHQFNSQVLGRLIIGYRNLQTDILNGDESPFEEFEDGGEEFLVLLDDDDDTTEVDEDDFARNRAGERIIANDNNSEAIFNENSVRQQSISAAYTLITRWQGDRWSWKWQLGSAFRGGQARYTAGGELGYFDETRAVISSGERVINFDTDVITNVNNLHLNSGLNAVLDNKLAIQLSGAFNYSDLVLEDQLGTALNGEHHFANVSGGLSLYYLLNENLMLHGTWNTSTRNPTAVEVSCADPDDPCRLPNAFLADPPLEAVRAMTLQSGITYKRKYLRLSTTLFRTSVMNDIYFVSAGPFRGSGYFDNIGNTQRLGWENSLAWSFSEKIRLQLAYTWLKATFEDDFTISSPNHPAEVDGELSVEAGDYIALIPKHNLSGQLATSITEKLEVGWTAIYNSGQYIRGDESNEMAPLDGYWRHDAILTYAFSDKLSCWIKAKNLMNAKYQTFGLLGEADEAGELLNEEIESNVFAGQASPRYMEFGIQLKF